MKKFLCIIIVLSFFNANIVFADTITNETIYQESVVNESEEIALTGIIDNVGEEIFIKGNNASAFSQQKLLTCFTDRKLIPNANYFLINPKHHENPRNNPDIGSVFPR